MAEKLIAWCGFLGAWLLVAGPVYQAALELQEQEFERERINAAVSTVPQPPEVSAWWWLLPPARWWLERRRSRVYREQVTAHLDRADLESMVRYLSKSTGWLFVSMGGFLIAVTETWHLVEVFDWPAYLFWVLLFLMGAVSLGNLVLRQKRSVRLLG